MTTNSQDGVEDIEQLYPVFEAMQKYDLILNIHGELPGASPLKAEAEYVHIVHNIHAAFPRLRIVLEHISTREGLEVVRQCGPTVCMAVIHNPSLHSTVSQACFDFF